MSDVLDHELVRPLAVAGLLEPSSVIDGSARVTPRAGRVGGVVVEGGRGAAFFVKGAVGGASAARIRAEARALDHLASTLGEGAVAPPLVSADPEAGRLVTHLVAGDPVSGVPMAEASRRDLCRAVGRALAAVHGTGPGPASPEGRDSTPWGLRLDRPALGDLEWLSPACVELLADLQELPHVASSAAAARRAWRAAWMTHGDVRWSNVILQRAPDGQVGRAVLVDWEFGGTGDPAWDVACVLAQLLSDWSAWAPRAPAPHAQAESFWSAYSDAAESEASPEILGRAAVLVGLRLIEYGIEHAQTEVVPDGAAVRHVQLGANLLRYPGRALRDLLGLKVAEP